MAQKEDLSLDEEINLLNMFRSYLMRDGNLFREAEISYQMVSLFMELNKLLKGERYSTEYLHEKAATIFSCWRNMLYEEGRMKI